MSLDILKAAKHKYGSAEVYYAEGESQPVTFEANKLKELSVRETSGIALRVIKNGRIGFTSTTNPDDEKALVARVGDLADLGSDARFSFPGPGSYPQTNVYDKRVKDITQPEMVALGRGLLGRLRDEWPDMLCEGRIGKSTGRMHIWNSEGVDFSYDQTGYYVYLGGKLTRGTDMLMLWEGHASSDYFGQEQADKVLDGLLQQLEYCKTISAPVSGDIPVIFTPRGVAATLMSPLLEGFNGKNIATGASPISSKTGQKVFDERLSVYDDPSVPGASGSRPCDDEGVPARRVTLIEKGTVGEGYFDLQSAGKARAKSSGSAHRSLSSPPSPGTCTIDIAKGDTPYEKMFEGIKEGLVVEELLGAGQGNELGGDFRANVSLGYRIEGGKITGRVKDTMIAGNVYEVLRQVEAISDAPEWVFGSMRTPAFRCRGVKVAAKSG